MTTTLRVAVVLALTYAGYFVLPDGPFWNEVLGGFLIGIAGMVSRQ